jgi:hypothetical protein
VTRQSFRTRPAWSGGLNSRAANLLDLPEVSLVCPNIFTYGGSASSKPRVLFAPRVDPAEIGFSMKKPCAVLNETGQKRSTNVVRRPQMRYSTPGQKIGPFRLLVIE